MSEEFKELTQELVQKDTLLQAQLFMEQLPSETLEKIYSKSRKKEYVKIRRELIKTLREQFELSTISIGKIIKKDHSTISHLLH